MIIIFQFWQSNVYLDIEHFIRFFLNNLKIEFNIYLEIEISMNQNLKPLLLICLIGIVINTNYHHPEDQDEVAKAYIDNQIRNRFS